VVPQHEEQVPLGGAREGRGRRKGVCQKRRRHGARRDTDRIGGNTEAPRTIEEVKKAIEKKVCEQETKGKTPRFLILGTIQDALLAAHLSREMMRKFDRPGADILPERYSPPFSTMAGMVYCDLFVLTVPKQFGISHLEVT